MKLPRRGRMRIIDEEWAGCTKSREGSEGSVSVRRWRRTHGKFVRPLDSLPRLASAKRARGKPREGKRRQAAALHIRGAYAFSGSTCNRRSYRSGIRRRRRGDRRGGHFLVQRAWLRALVGWIAEDGNSLGADLLRGGVCRGRGKSRLRIFRGWARCRRCAARLFRRRLPGRGLPWCRWLALVAIYFAHSRLLARWLRGFRRIRRGFCDLRGARCEPARRCQGRRRELFRRFRCRGLLCAGKFRE